MLLCQHTVARRLRHPIYPKQHSLHFKIIIGLSFIFVKISIVPLNFPVNTLFMFQYFLFQAPHSTYRVINLVLVSILHDYIYYTRIFFFSFSLAIERKHNPRVKELLLTSSQPQPDWIIYTYGILKNFNLLCTSLRMSSTGACFLRRTNTFLRDRWRLTSSLAAALQDSPETWSAV